MLNKKNINKKFLFIFFCFSILSLTGCTPTLPLAHTQNIDEHYKKLGTIEISRFKDDRPSIQTLNSGSWKPYLNGQIYTGNTNPDMLSYLQLVLAQEAQKSGIFEVTSPAEYQLTGFVKSLAIIQNNYSTPKVPAYSAIVKYQANLEKGGIVIFSKTIELYFNMYQWQLKNFDSVNITLETPQQALDMAITLSAKTLFSSIQRALLDGSGDSAATAVSLDNPDVTPLPLPNVDLPGSN